jgi:hypothetical protein
LTLEQAVSSSVPSTFCLCFHSDQLFYLLIKSATYTRPHEGNLKQCWKKSLTFICYICTEGWSL